MAFFYDLLRRAQDLVLHGLAAEGTLELADLGVGLAQLTRRDDILTGLHRRRRAGFRKALPRPDHARRNVELAAQLRERLLAAQNSLDRCPLELRAENPPPVCLPWMIAHGASRGILRPHGEQSKRGALKEDFFTTAIVLGLPH